MIIDGVHGTSPSICYTCTFLFIFVFANVQSRERVGRWHSRIVPECCALLSFEAGGWTSSYQELEVNDPCGNSGKTFGKVLKVI